MEVGGQKSEVRGRKSEVGSRRLEVGSRSSEVGVRRLEAKTRVETASDLSPPKAIGWNHEFTRQLVFDLYLPGSSQGRSGDRIIPAQTQEIKYH